MNTYVLLAIKSVGFFKNAKIEKDWKTGAFTACCIVMEGWKAGDHVTSTASLTAKADYQMPYNWTFHGH
jgi:hypothetical protein